MTLRILLQNHHPNFDVTWKSHLNLLLVIHDDVSRRLDDVIRHHSLPDVVSITKKTFGCRRRLDFLLSMQKEERKSSIQQMYSQMH